MAKSKLILEILKRQQKRQYSLKILPLFGCVLRQIFKAESNFYGLKGNNVSNRDRKQVDLG